MSALFQRGLLLAQQGRNDLAIPEFQRHLATEPGDAFAHAYLGICFAELEKFEDATRHVREGIQLQPDLAFAHYAAAYVLQQRNRPGEALAPVQEAIRLDPYFDAAFGLLAQIHLSEKRHQQALEAAEQGLEIDAENVVCQNLRAMALKNLGRHGDAGDALDSALARDPENSYTHANKGWALLEKNKHEEALRHFQESLRLEPSNDWAREGVLVALKSRYRLYALMLKYFLWMAKLSSKNQWAVVIGVYMGSRVLSAISLSNPPLAPFIDPLRVLLFAFCIMTWIADPLFNLALRCNRYGRLALTRDQRNGSTIVGSLLAISLASLVFGYAVGPLKIFLPISMVSGFLILPFSAIFRCPEGWPRRMMTLYSAIVALAGVAIAGLLLAEGRTTATESWSEPLFTACLLIFIGGIIASGVVANILISRRIKR